MGTPIPGDSFGDDSLRDFDTRELQILTPTTTSVYGAWGAGGQQDSDCMLYNNATAGVYVVFSTVAQPTALNKAGNASGTRTVYVAPGAYLTVQKRLTGYFAAITDVSSTGDLYLHAGKGS